MKNSLSIFLLLLLMSPVVAQFNNSAHFFGDAGYIKIESDSSLQMSEEITLEAWVKIDSFHNSQIGICGTWDDNIGNFRTYFLWIRNNRPEFLVSNNGSGFQRVLGKTLLAGKWYHLASTFDGTKLSFYRNDTLDAEASMTGPIATNNRPFFIGRTESGSNGADYLFGNIDELRVWNKARNGKQIKSTSQDTLSKNYYSTKDSGLVAYYRFDEVIVTDSDSTLKDLSVESNDGTVIGKVEFDSSVIITNLPQKAFPKAASNFQLLQNYPNPFNPITTIRYELSENSKVNISVFDLTGRKIKTLASGQQSTGVHELVFDASVLTSGVYIYKLITNSFEKSRKMIVLK